MFRQPAHLNHRRSGQYLPKLPD